ncbi:MAG: hypothetical protein GY856_39740 [bacterium]|nr:hypothetical protein [bacterium]
MINEFLRLGCAPGLLATGVFPNAKELSESMGAFESVRQGLIEAGRAEVLGDSNVVFYDVGSGRAPRTAVLAAFRSRWKCVAIDPLLAPASDRLRQVERLHLAPLKVGDYTPPAADAVKMAVVTCVHHHASLSATFDALRLAERPGYCLVSIPCCFADDVDPGWDLVRENWGIRSPQRTVYRRIVWP